MCRLVRAVFSEVAREPAHHGPQTKTLSQSMNGPILMNLLRIRMSLTVL